MASEGGLRPNRTEFVRETRLGLAEPPTDPTWEAYSDNIRTFDPTIDPGVEPQEGLGAAFPTDHFTGTVIPEFSIEYDLQRAPAAAGDASYDGMVRRADNALQNSHTVVRRMYQQDLDPENTEEGTAVATSKDTRQYLVYLGARIDTVTINGDPTAATPVTVNLDYIARKVEAHKIDQPLDAGENLTVAGLEAGTEITIENEGAGVTETVTADGATIASYSDIDAAYLNQAQDADVTISDSGGETLMTIKGANSYDFNEGDRGVPALGSGAHAGAVGTAYEVVQGDTFNRRAGETLADEINSTSITISNNVSTDETTTGPRPFIAANNAEATVDATLIGEREYFKNLRDALTSQGGDFSWALTGFTLTITDAHATDVDETEDAGEGVMTVDLTLSGEGVTIA